MYECILQPVEMREHVPRSPFHRVRRDAGNQHFLKRLGVGLGSSRNSNEFVAVVDLKVAAVLTRNLARPKTWRGPTGPQRVVTLLFHLCKDSRGDICVHSEPVIPHRSKSRVRDPHLPCDHGLKDSSSPLARGLVGDYMCGDDFPVPSRPAAFVTQGTP